MTRRIATAAGAAVCLLLCAAETRAQSTVTVDQSKEGIVIDGFGGFGAMMPWWNSGPFYNDNFAKMAQTSARLDQPGTWPTHQSYSCVHTP